jgi:P-type conjugative transfer protein TrbG
MKNYLSMILAAAAIATAPLAASAANPVTGADGVLRFPFGDTMPPTINCEPFFICDITLEPGESIQNVAIGDSVRWILSPATSGNAGDTPHILIKPTDVNLTTNLIVTTNRRSYSVNLHSVKNNPMLHVGFFYPQNLAQAFPTPAPSPSPSPSPVEVPISAAALDFRYVATGERKILPSHAFNDGKHTYLQFVAQLPQMPIVLEVGPNGDQLINYRIKDGTTYVIDGVPDRVALVVGSGKGSQRATIWRKI